MHMTIPNRYPKEGQMKHYQQCKCCLMDTNTKYISFDENGICTFCHDYANFEAKRPHENIYFPDILATKIREIKNARKNKKYDCIPGASGGVVVHTSVTCGKVVSSSFAVDRDEFGKKPVSGHRCLMLRF